nr:transposase [Streptomyces sp. MK7]
MDMGRWHRRRSIFAELLQFLVLRGGRPVVAFAGVCLGLADPAAQGLLVDAQVLGDVRGRRRTRPEVLANLARGAMRRKHTDLVEALTGNFTDHHGFMVRVLIHAIRDASARIATLEEEIKRQITPFHRQVELLITSPGISTTVAHVMIAEMGADMSRFPTAVHLTAWAAWAGLAPPYGAMITRAKAAPGQSRYVDRSVPCTARDGGSVVTPAAETRPDQARSASATLVTCHT